MTDTPTPAPDVAVQMLRATGWIIPDGGHAYDTVHALHARRWLHDPKRVAALEAVAAAARGALDVDPTAGSQHADRHMRLEAALAALDAAPAGTTADGEIGAEA